MSRISVALPADSAAIDAQPVSTDRACLQNRAQTRVVDTSEWYQAIRPLAAEKNGLSEPKVDESNGRSGRAWAAFFLEHHRSLTAYAVSLAGNLPDAQDLLQDALVRMVGRRRAVRAAKPYVLRCIRNLMIDRRRAARGRPRTTSINTVECLLADVESLPSGREEDLRELRTAMQALSHGEREVIVLKIFCGLTFKEIAGILAQPLGTLTSRYARALDRLRSVLARPSWELKHV